MQGSERSPITLAFFDAGETSIGQTPRRISLIELNGKRSVCVEGVQVYVYEADDIAAEVVRIAMLSCANVANDVAIARAFGSHRNTVGHLKRRLAAGGMTAVLPAQRGPRGPHKVTTEVLEVIRSKSDQLNVPAVVRAVRDHTGISLSQSHVRRLAHDHRPTTVELQLFDRSTNEGPDGDAAEEAGIVHDNEAEVSSAVASSALVKPDVPEGGPFEAHNFDPPVAPPEHARGTWDLLCIFRPSRRSGSYQQHARASRFPVRSSSECER